MEQDREHQQQLQQQQQQDRLEEEEEGGGEKENEQEEDDSMSDGEQPKPSNLLGLWLGLRWRLRVDRYRTEIRGYLLISD